MSVETQRWRRARGHLAMLTVSTIFSVWNVLAERLMGRCGGGFRCPMMLAAYREIGATPIMLVACGAAHGLRPRLSPHRPDTACWFLAGACLWATQLFYILGVNLTSADVAALYQPLSQVATTALAFVFGVESYRGRSRRRNAAKLGGVALGFCGGAAIAAPHLRVLAQGHVEGGALGHLALLVGTLAAGAYNVAQPPLLERNPPLRVAALAYTIAAALMLVTAGAAQAPLVSLDTDEAVIVAYAAFAACFVAYSLLAYALFLISPSEVALYGALQAPLTATLAYAATREVVPSIRDVFGGGLAVVGLALVAAAEHGAAKDPPPPVGINNPLLADAGSSASNPSRSPSSRSTCTASPGTAYSSDC